MGPGASHRPRNRVKLNDWPGRNPSRLNLNLQLCLLTVRKGGIGVGVGIDAIVGGDDMGVEVGTEEGASWAGVA